MSEEAEEQSRSDAEIAKHYGLDPEVVGLEVKKQPKQATEPDDEPEELPDEPDQEPEDQSDQGEPDNGLDEKWDKRMQKYDQLLATLDREVQQLSQKPTEKQAERVEKAKGNLDKYMSEAEVDPYTAPREIAQEVLADRDRVERLMQEHEAMKRDLEEREAARASEVAQLRFAVDFPELKGRYTEFQQKTYESMVDDYGADEVQSMSPKVFGAIANERFMKFVDEAAPDEPKDEAPVKKSGAKKPKGSHIIKKQSGNSGKPDYDDPDAEMAKIRAAWGGGRA